MSMSLIPCCTCGAIISPNPSNQCAACLATVDIGSVVRRGVGGADLIVNQCRKCRRYDRNGEGKIFVPLDPESPELMAVLLKLIPALSRKGSSHQHMRRSHGVEALHLLDSMFIWTEPNSMRIRLMLTLKADINESPRTVSIQQRVKVEFIVRWKECPNCTKESRQSTWQAIVQLRQKRSNHGDNGNDASSRKGLIVLELAIARNAEMRKNILSAQTKKNGLDFYFATLDKARLFTQYLAKVAPMRIKTSQKMVSEDVKNNTANIRHTLSCDMVPLCRYDLVVAEKHNAKGVGRLSGRLCLVLKISSLVHLVDASPMRGSDVMSSNCMADLHVDNYWKGGAEKAYRCFLSSNRLVRFVVLDVEMCCGDERDRYRNVSNSGDDANQLYQGPHSGLSKYALADVEVARESDFGVNDDTFRCVTHLGNLLSVGDLVLGYDLTSVVLSSEAEWCVENSFNSSFVMPDAVLVRKIKGAGASEELSSRDVNGDIDGEEGRKQRDKAKSSASKKRERRLKKEEQKQKVLEEAAARMGLDRDVDGDDMDDEAEAFSKAVQIDEAKLEREIEMDEDLAEDLEIVERELARGTEEILNDQILEPNTNTDVDNDLDSEQNYLPQK